MRTYGTILTEKLASEKCTTRASPCVRYFVNAEGERISSPEEFEMSRDAFITPTEYRKRVDGLPKRDERGKFVKKSAEGTEGAFKESKEVEGVIVGGGGEECSRASYMDEKFGLEWAEKELRHEHPEWKEGDICPDCGKFEVEGKTGLCKSCNDELKNTDMSYFDENKDDLEGLAEPEPAWGTLSDNQLARIMGAVNKLETEEDDEELLTEIGGWLKGIRERTIKRAGIKFDERMTEMMAGVQG